MKGLILALTLLVCFPLSAAASPWLDVIGMYSAASPAKTYDFQEDWEAISDGEDWDNDGNWAASPDWSGYMVGDDAQYHGGSLSGYVIATTYDMTETAALTFGDTTATVDFWVRFDEMPAGTTTFWRMTDGGTDLTKISIETDGDLMADDGYSTVNIGTASADTWYRIEVWCDIPNDQFSFWFGGAASGSNPHDSTLTADCSGMDSITFTCQASANYHWWVDDLDVYQGARQ